MKSLLLSLCAVVGFSLPGWTAEPLFKPHDVVAFVGGADLVAMSEYGYLEMALTRALPADQLRFRNLAWEGDTVTEQRRDLNFPPLEAQLDKVGATVVITDFGQMESFGGKEKLPEFIAAYEKLLERTGGAGKRRFLLLSPVSKHRFAPGAAEDLAAYTTAIGQLAQKLGLAFVDCHEVLITEEQEHQTNPLLSGHTGYEGLAGRIAKQLGAGGLLGQGALLQMPTPADESLRAKIAEKNRLWFNYWRPQNWAFLNGDRTSQPSSRDHLDPSKRWFPDEIEQYLPLIEAKEREIDALSSPVVPKP
jgi:lysophospholipase L1-like esterase